MTSRGTESVVYPIITPGRPHAATQSQRNLTFLPNLFSYLQLPGEIRVLAVLFSD
jgi:hypothetical protein